MYSAKNVVIPADAQALTNAFKASFFLKCRSSLRAKAWTSRLVMRIRLGSDTIFDDIGNLIYFLLAVMFEPFANERRNPFNIISAIVFVDFVGDAKTRQDGADDLRLQFSVAYMGLHTDRSAIRGPVNLLIVFDKLELRQQIRFGDQ